MFDRKTGMSSVIGLALIAFAVAACDEEPSADMGYLAAKGGNGSVAQAAEATTDKRVAISHTFRLQLPSSVVEDVQQKHLAECAKLGCTVLSTRVDRPNDDSISAAISVRIAPNAYQNFVAIITAPPAKLLSHAELAEDKTIAVLDVDKRLEVKLALRDRLTAMLHDPGQKSAADLAAIEKELAQVQGDIETITAERDYLKTITETIKVDVTYWGTVSEAAGLDLSPIDRAVKGIGRTAVQSVAALVSFIAATVPWLPIIALLVWGVRRGWRRWKSRHAIA